MTIESRFGSKDDTGTVYGVPVERLLYAQFRLPMSAELSEVNRKTKRKEVRKMYKGFVVSIAFVLMSSGAFAAIGQAEGFGVGASNLVLLLGGPGAVYGGNVGMVGHGQQATDGWGTIAMQNEAGILNQGASAVSTFGPLGVAQDAGAAGQQWQLAAGGLGLQGQDIDLYLAQELFKLDGVGGVLGAQGAVVGQVQIIVGPYGVSGDAQFVGAAQFGAVGGGPGATSTITEGLSIGADQY